LQGHIPVALKVGYTAPYSFTEARTQSIVVVYEDWTVACYDSALHLLWTKEVGHHSFELDHLIKYFRINSAAVYIAPLKLSDGASSGTVIVGASMARRSALAGVKTASEDMVMRSLQEGTHPQAEALAKLSHFSVFALDSDTGHVLWKHDGMEVRSEQYSRSLPQHAYTLDLKDLMAKTHHSAGINDWTVFRQSLLDDLPHLWTSAEHTSMRIAHFIRRHVGASAARSVRPRRGKGEKGKPLPAAERGAHKDTSKGSGRNGKPATALGSLPLLQGQVKAHSLTKSAALPHDASEHTENPNVIVVHSDKGLEVIALRTGIPITSLALPEGKMYADVDGDGVVDTIVILDNPRSVNQHRSEFAHHQFEYAGVEASLQHCMIVVMSALPARSQLFNGTVGADRPSLRESFTDKHERHVYKVQKPPSEAPVEGEATVPRGQHPSIMHAIPLVMAKLEPRTMTESKEKDIIVAIHTGVVTSYSGSGNFNWQIRNAPKWATDDVLSADADSESPKEPSDADVVASVVGFDSDADRAQGIGAQNSVYSSILITGEAEMHLVSREGDLLASAELPKGPLAYPVLGDFDNDGVTDIILVTDGAVLGFHVAVVKATDGVLIALVLLIAVAVVVFCANIQRVSPVSASSARGVPASVLDRQSHSAAANLSGNSLHPRRPHSKTSTIGGVFQIVRSTDEHHLD